jgi:separase
MTIHLVGFIGHVILKLELLQVARQICEHLSIGQDDSKSCWQMPGGLLVTHHQDFVQLSVQLAHEYVKLGKLREAGSVYKRSLGPMQIQTVSGDTRVVLLLRHAESLTRIGDIGQRLFICHCYCRSPDFATSIALYNEALQLSETLPKNEGESSTLDRVHSHVNRLRRAALAASVFAGIKLAQVSSSLVYDSAMC